MRLCSFCKRRIFIHCLRFLFSCPALSGAYVLLFLCRQHPSFIRGGCQFHYCDRFGTCQPLYLSAAAFHSYTCRPSCRGYRHQCSGQLPAGAFFPRYYLPFHPLAGYRFQLHSAARAVLPARTVQKALTRRRALPVCQLSGCAASSFARFLSSKWSRARYVGS